MDMLIGWVIGFAAGILVTLGFTSAPGHEDAAKVCKQFHGKYVKVEEYDHKPFDWKCVVLDAKN